MAVFQLPTDGIADGAITTAKINASVSLGASVNVILDGTDGGGSNAGEMLQKAMSLDEIGRAHV